MVKNVGIPSLIFLNLSLIKLNINIIKEFFIIFLSQFTLYFIIFLYCLIKKKDKLNNFLNLSLTLGFSEMLIYSYVLIKFFYPIYKYIPILFLINNNFIFITFFKYLIFYKFKNIEETSSTYETPIEQGGNPIPELSNEEEEEEQLIENNNFNLFLLFFNSSNIIIIISIFWSILNLNHHKIINNFINDLEKIVIPSGIISITMEIKSFNKPSYLTLISLLFHYILLPFLFFIYGNLFNLSKNLIKIFLILSCSPL